jgi:predicted 3-demethylubiquinone-9 3-methyltransferase (glyoxalase superfamily)
MKSVTPFLWFNGQAEEAAKFYVSIFKGKGSKIVSTSDMLVTFRILGQEFMALNGGPHYKFNPAFSMYVDCANQREVDTLWTKLSRGAKKKGRCGWLTDRYGLSWQIIPSALGQLMEGGTEEQSARVFKAMLKMRKLDIAKLKRAYAGK